MERKLGYNFILINLKFVGFKKKLIKVNKLINNY